MKKKFLIIFLLIMLLYSPIISNADDIDNETIDVNAEITSIKPEKNIEPPKTNSRACVVIDRNTNMILYGKKENEKRKMASTTKIMTAIVVIENGNLNDIVEVSKKAAGTGGSRLGLKSGDKVKVNDLLYGLMLHSGNDAAVALAEHISGSIPEFANLMNKKAQELGLKNTHFETPHGLDSDEHYTTAYELALLANYALQNKTFAQIVGTKNCTISINGQPKNLRNTNELLGTFNGIYGVKTGFTNGANRCLVTSCKKNDLDIICVVLGADTKKFRTQDSIKLINYVFDNYTKINIKEVINDKFENWKQENEINFEITKGISNDLDLKLEDIKNPVIPVRKDKINHIDISIDFKNKYEAPLLKDSKIGTLSVNIPDYLNISYNIYNNNEIKKKSWYTYFFDFIKNFNNYLK